LNLLDAIGGVPGISAKAAQLLTMNLLLIGTGIGGRYNLVAVNIHFKRATYIASDTAGASVAF
jgi:hypothetical protein